MVITLVCRTSDTGSIPVNSAIFLIMSQVISSLEETVSFNEIKQSRYITAYHATNISSNLKQFIEKSKIDRNLHVGSFLQAVDRADYKVNDEEEFDSAFIHEVIISKKRLCPVLVDDNEDDANVFYENSFKSKYDLLVYKNRVEGLVRERNLSLIVLNPKIIVQTRIHSIWKSKQLSTYASLAQR